MNGFRIGDVIIPNRVVLAPMAGVSDLPYRLLAKEMGCGLLFNEMISAMALVQASGSMKNKLKILDQERPLAMQLLGKDPFVMAEAAGILLYQSAPEIIDINCGCPVPKVVKNGEGAALMRNPDLIGRIVAAVTAAVKVPVTVKIRSGWSAEEITAVAVARVAVSAGAAAVTVHARTRDQLYRGKADWTVITRVKKAVPVPVIGNGDVDSGPTAAAMLEETGCDAVMVGRAARGNPWIFRQLSAYIEDGQVIPPPSARERMEMAVRHLRLLADFKGESLAVRQMRGHSSHYIRDIREGAKLRERAARAESVQEMEAIFSAAAGLDDR